MVESADTAPHRPKCAVLIVAAGRGSRMGGSRPKQYLALAGRPILRHTVAGFLRHPAVDVLRCVIHPDDRELYEGAVQGLGLEPPVDGGAERQDSVRNGLEALAGDLPEIVLVHDAVRPFASAEIIDAVVATLRNADGAVPAVPVNDTLKRRTGSFRTETVDRAGLWRAQTPQGFRYDALLAAHRACTGAALSDDAAVAEAANLEVVLVPGSEDNIKITSPADLRLAEGILRSNDTVRVGLGFDVHRFGAGDRVILGGIVIPHEQALEGHSDADVVLHAVTDAVLGSIGAGDIGVHFPPSEERWRAADSALFVGHAMALLRQKGGVLEHLDITVICEAPRIGPYRAAMIQRLANVTGTDASRISVKATTTEGLGFTGRKEGIAAQAVATVRIAQPA